MFSKTERFCIDRMNRHGMSSMLEAIMSRHWDRKVRARLNAGGIRNKRRVIYRRSVAVKNQFRVSGRRQRPYAENVHECGLRTSTFQTIFAKLRDCDDVVARALHSSHLRTCN
jgi:hypothetical protein